MENLHLYILLDKSGSMMEREKILRTSFWEFVSKQKDLCIENQQVFVTIGAFHHSLSILYENVPIQEIQPLTQEEYRPSGSTALFDAMGFMLEKIKLLISPRKVMMIIITDGEENDSQSFSQEDIRKLVEETKEYTEIIYLGSNQDAILNGAIFGATERSSLTYRDENLPEALDSLSQGISRARRGESQGVEFSPLERESSSTPYRIIQVDDS